MESLQIRLPKKLLVQVDNLVKSGFYRSRSDLLRQSLQDYLMRCSFFGAAPYILGPFTKEDMEKLKNTTLKDLEVPELKKKEIDRLIKSLEID